MKEKFRLDRKAFWAGKHEDNEEHEGAGSLTRLGRRLRRRSGLWATATRQDFFNSL